MKKLFFPFILILLFPLIVTAQNFEVLLSKHNKESIPYISVEEIQKDNSFILLDTREIKEYVVSHLKDARYVGYNNFNINDISEKVKDKNSKIVVYCSVGIRSEDIGEKLKNAGFNNVFNLYGGIFKWKNKGLKVYDINGKETEKVHTFSAYWSKWLTKGEKVYE